MTNREKYILRCNEFDMLTGIQLAMAHGEKCVVDAIMRKQRGCTNYINQDVKVCSRCIQRWLNEEAE